MVRAEKEPKLSFGLWLWDGWVKIINWTHREFQKSMDRFSEDLRSMRIIWVWLLLALWFWVVIWGMLYEPEHCASTIVVTLGGMIATIIPAYILSKHGEKMLQNKVELERIKQEYGAGD